MSKRGSAARRWSTAAALAAAAGCSGPLPVDDPMAALTRPGESPRRQLGAMVALDAEPENPAYVEALCAVLYRPGYTLPVREAAFERLERLDEEALKTTIRRYLPRLGARAWQERLCELIVERDWIELSPALVSAWARPIPFVDDFERAEYAALARLHGEDRVIDVVFDLFVESDGVAEQGLRGRCWELLHRLGRRDRLIALLENRSAAPDDVMLSDLRAAAVELGVVPRTREELLWVRKLRQPENRSFWAQAADVAADLPPQRRRGLELRDLPVLIAAAQHAPELLDAGAPELYRRLKRYLDTTRQHVDPGRFQGWPGSYSQQLAGQRDRLGWSDLAAMLLAVEAVEVPQVAAHLFDYAERDRADRRCEYGGVIDLDDRGRYEVLEFPPRFRRRDNEFIAPQAMMDAGYTSLFHFHLHAQRYRNGRYAGPHLPDLNYADSTRANCLVFTFIDRDTLNMDFYRHDRVIVDLGEVQR